MFEKSTRLRVKSLLESEFVNFTEVEKTLKSDQQGRQQSYPKSAKEHKMTRKPRNRRFTASIFQSGYCAGCHIPYTNLNEHIQSKRHLKLVGDDFISIRSFDSFLELEAEDLEPRSKMPRTREKSAYDKVKYRPMSPVESDSGHHLRSRKNINYMPPLSEDDSLLEEPVVKEYREPRSSSRLLAKHAESLLTRSEVWNSGRPKRLCNRRRLSTDSRIVNSKHYFNKVEIQPSKLRSGVLPFNNSFIKPPETPTNKHKDYGSLSKLKKPRSTELSQLNTEAENFLFPKKDDTTDEEDEDESEDEKEVNRKTKRNYASSVTDTEESQQSIEDEESMYSTNSESNKTKKKRRTHAEAFIMDNQKYYKFETPGTRLRYQGSYLAPVPPKPKHNGDIVKTHEKGCSKKFNLNVDEYQFSFESVPKSEAWYETFERRDLGNEKYVYTDTNLWNSLILPYELDYVPPLDPRKCLIQYNQIKKCLIEPTSTSTSCSTPDPSTSNSSLDNHDEDSKISTATELSSTSTFEEMKPILPNKRRPALSSPPSKKTKNPRKSPRQHASTLAILSSLIQQRKRKIFRGTLPSILEETNKPQVKKKKTNKVDYLGMWNKVQEELTVNEEEADWEFDVCNDGDEGIEFRRTFVIEELFDDVDNEGNQQNMKKVTNGVKPGRKPGKRKKNMTGWPRNKKYKKEPVATREEGGGSRIKSVSDKQCEKNISNSTDRSVKKHLVSVKKKSNSENSKQNDQSSLSDRDRVKHDLKSDQTNDKVLTNKVNNSDGFSSFDLQYQPIVRVQKLDRKHIFIDNNKVVKKRNNSPKRINRRQRRMPASPKSPRMLRRPRGRWYRER